MWTVYWYRKSEPEFELKCTDLDPRTAMARVYRTTRLSGPIVITKIEKKRKYNKNG